MSTESDIFREWDLYDRIGRANYMRQREVASAIRATLRSRPGPLRVLDLGCGDGRMSYDILSETPVASFVGVDLSASALERLAARGSPGSSPGGVERSLRLGDIRAELGDMPPDTFDLVHAGYSLHHYPTDGKPPVLDEISRVLAPGGILIWTDILRMEGETRDEYLLRLNDEIGTNWVALSPDERATVVGHVRACDFPEPESWMIREAEARGLRFEERLYHDPYYTALVFGFGGRCPPDIKPVTTIS